jgi:hypothetical protein
MSKGKKILWAVLIIGLVSGGIFALGSSGILGSTATEISLTPETFNPVYVDSAKFTVRDPDGTFLGEISTASPMSHYHDSLGRYPDVDIMFSSPFPCESDGTYLTSTSQIEHTTSKSIYVDGKLYFLSDQYYFAVDVGARTYANTVNWQIAPEIILSPLRGAQFSYTPIYHQFYWTDPGPTDNPDGNLIMAINGDCNIYDGIGVFGPCVSTHSTTTAKITTSLFPMDFQVSTFNPVPSAGHQLTDAIQYISNYWGTRAIVIQPNLTIKGYNDYIRYSYDRQIILPNGTRATVQVDTTSAMVGFAECYKSSIESKGVIPNYLDPYLRIKVPLATDDPTEDKGGVTQPEMTAPLLMYDMDLTGSVKYQQGQDEITTLGAAANIYGAMLGNGLEGKDITINLNTLDKFSLPTKISPRAEFKLQELSTLNIAKTDVTYNTLWWYGGTLPATVNKITAASGTTTIKYPYKLSVQNVYAISRIVFRVVIISENNPTVYVSGKPIDPSKISDFEMTSYGLNPTIDDFVEHQPFFVWDTNSIIILVVCIMAAIVITVLVILFRPRSSTSGGPRTTTVKFSLFHFGNNARRGGNRRPRK